MLKQMLFHVYSVAVISPIATVSISKLPDTKQLQKILNIYRNHF